QVNTGGGFQNIAAAAGLAATGWSWSSKFADLDQDGLLDLYVVNGMIAAELFSGLPQNQWVEPNQALRNGGNRRFFPAPQWRLDARSSGRGMSMADFDNDGDLDIVVNNLLSPALLFENQICGGSSLLVDLHWPQQANNRALGAVLRLHTSHGVYTRDVRAASGYLSGDPARVHFGLPAGATISQLEITWPDGARSQVEAPAANVRLSISRN
ncbi:MAG: CRTAC1 family protein, partial [Chloroflexi bacterium]